jgi:hypothetical protein
MRWCSTVVGIVYLALPTVLSMGFWDTLIDPSVELAYARIQLGMTLPEVEAIMGKVGQPQRFCIYGPRDYMRTHSFFINRWDDAFTAVNIVFSGPSGRPTASHIEKMTPTPSVRLQRWGSRAGLLVLALIGVRLVARGLWPRRTQRMLSASAEPAPA